MHLICICIASRLLAQGFHTLVVVQVRDGGLLLPHARLSSGTRPRRLRWQWSAFDPLFDILRSPVADPHAGARGHCAGAGGGGAPAVGARRGGGGTACWTRSRPPVVGRWWTPTDQGGTHR
ncbi:hypothetical protein EVAR_35490_1 [Eumeta japonica]|uniref:Secreted protein n=1 Tax=Eumeta variegata TaxID=151549 RepID=A0A4C1X754_EUMVA|nr:hypothetical protein EVAR_35490_1 [Eumeta japonica]